MAKVWVVTSQLAIADEKGEQPDMVSVEGVFADRSAAVVALEKLKQKFEPNGNWVSHSEQAKAGSRKLSDVWALEGDCIHLMITESEVKQKSAAAGGKPEPKYKVGQQVLIPRGAMESHLVGRPEKITSVALFDGKYCYKVQGVNGVQFFEENIGLATKKPRSAAAGGK